MRILHVIPFFTPQMGGSAQVCYQLARHLGERGHEVTVLTSNFGIHESKFPAGSFQVIFLPNLVAQWGFYVTPSMIAWAKENLCDFDLIHMHTVRTFQNAVIRHYALQNHIPYILSAHGTLPYIEGRTLPKKLYDWLVGRRLLASASRMVAVSRTEAEQYRQAGIEPDRIQVIYNGLDLSEFEHLPARGCFRAKLDIPDPNTKIILFLGRIHNIKGIDYLIEAFSKIQWDCSPILLLIAGPDAGELGNLHRLVNQLSISDKVRFLGPLFGEEKLAAYVDADILASTSRYEIFGLVPFEALYCNTPVIVSDVGGTGELISETGAGYSVRFGDLEQLTNTLEHILSSPEEAQQKILIGKNLILQMLDWKVISREMENVYQEVTR